MNKLNTDEVLTKDAHLIQSFADLNGLKQADARTVIVEAEGAFVTDSEGNKLIDGILVNGSAKSIRIFSSFIRHMQSGYLYHYAFSIIIGLLLLIAIFVHGVFY